MKLIKLFFGSENRMNSKIKLKNTFQLVQHSYRFLSSGTQVLNEIYSDQRTFMKKELIGYSMEQMYNVVSDVKNYHKFIPYVKKSKVHTERDDGFAADLVVGFTPITEAYTSIVNIKQPRLVSAECNDGKLFKYLKNEWHFSPGVKDVPQSCIVDFLVIFRFKSGFHMHIANLFFDLLCEQMEYAFQAEVKKRYGAPALKNVIIISKKI